MRPLYFFKCVNTICLNFNVSPLSITNLSSGPQRIWTAGEFEHDTRQSRAEAGGVIVPPVLLRDMQALRDYLPGMKEKYGVLCFEEGK